MDQDAVKKLSLNTFCKFNMVFLDFYRILSKADFSSHDVYISGLFSGYENIGNSAFAHKCPSESLYLLLGKYMNFVLDYFTWNIYTYDCEKNHFFEKNVEIFE